MRGAPTVPFGVLDRSFRSTRPEREGRLLRYRAHSRHCDRRRADERHTHRERNNPGCRTLRPAIAETPSSFPVQNSRHSSRANGALTKEHVEHCLDVALIAAVGPAGVGIVVESSTGCGQSLSILLRHRCRVLLQHRVLCCAHQEGCEISLVLLLVESCGGHDFGRRSRLGDDRIGYLA